MSTRRASEDALDELHAATAEAIADQIRKYKNGEILDPRSGLPEPVPAALLSAAIKFLKDNGVDRAIKAGDPTDLLKDELPQFADNVVPFSR